MIVAQHTPQTALQAALPPSMGDLACFLFDRLLALRPGRLRLAKLGTVAAAAAHIVTARPHLAQLASTNVLTLAEHSHQIRDFFIAFNTLEALLPRLDLHADDPLVELATKARGLGTAIVYTLTAGATRQ